MESIEVLLMQYPIVMMLLAIGGSLVVAATAWIKFTETKSDDEWLEKLLAKPVIGPLVKFFERHSLIERKSKDPSK